MLGVLPAAALPISGLGKIASEYVGLHSLRLGN